MVGFKAFLGPTVGDLPEPSAASLVRAMRAVGEAGLRLGVHAEDRDSVEAGVQAMHAGRSPEDAAAHADSRPPLAEVRAIDRVAGLAATTDCPIHVFHLTSVEGLAAVEAWRREGVDITCELTPHHAFLDSRDVAPGRGPRCA